jgi:NTE family protein
MVTTRRRGAAPAPTVALVIAGAGARGAYEIGALSVLLPWLCERGERPRIVVGTSAGAMNAVLTAAMLEEPDPAEGSRRMLDVWRRAARAGVFRPLVFTVPGLGLRYLARVAGIGDAPVTSVLDPAPLRSTLAAFEHWPAMHQGIAEGRLEAVAMIATATGRRRTEVFVETASGRALPADDAARRIAYLPARLSAEHVMASAAIPVAFPPVRLWNEEGGAGDWYLDGGVRLNAPIKPALDLGAQRLVIVATHPLGEESDPLRPDPRRLDLFGAFATVITSALVDRMIEDVRALDRVNRLLAAGATGTDFRPVPYLFVGPERSGRIPELAEAALHTFRGLDAVRNPDIALLDRLIGGTHSTHGELLSYLLFDPDFVDSLIEAGQRDARAALAAHGDDPWRLTRTRG